MKLILERNNGVRYEECSDGSFYASINYLGMRIYGLGETLKEAKNRMEDTLQAYKTITN